MCLSWRSWVGGVFPLFHSFCCLGWIFIGCYNTVLVSDEMKKKMKCRLCSCISMTSPKAPSEYPKSLLCLSLSGLLECSCLRQHYHKRQSFCTSQIIESWHVMLRPPNRGNLGPVGSLRFIPLYLQCQGCSLLQNCAFLCPVIQNWSKWQVYKLIGQINSLLVKLVNIYGPNTGNSAFFSKVFDLIPDDNLSHTLIAGNFNCYLCNLC